VNRSQAQESPKVAARRLAAGAIRDGYVPEAVHAYTDSTGAPVYWRIRAKHPDTGEKWIRPMKLNGIGYVLGEPGAEEFPNGKPLYRLHEVVARPDEPVIVTEGEFKADKLAALGLLVTTSGAADSAGKADWQPLAGREVMVWPDNDAAGDKYAQAVLAKLKALRCKVRLLDVGQLGLGPKGDAADWLGARSDATAQDVLALPCAGDEAVQDRTDLWPEPRQIKADLPSAPGFDGHLLLPKVLADFVLDEADRMPCAPDYIAAALMVALGSVIGARCALKPKRRDDWIITPNLFGGAVGDPSAKKTPAVSIPTRFLDRLEAAEAERHAEAMKVHAGELAAFEARKSAIQSAMKKAAAGKGDGIKMDVATRDMAGLAPPDEPVQRRFRTSDATVPMLGAMLAKNPTGMLVFRDELMGLLASWDREGCEGDRAFYLEGWNGTGSFAVDRIGRGSTFVKTLCISVFGGIQPDLMGRYLAGAASGLDNDGRVQRFQVMVYPELVPWEWRDRYAVKGAREAVRDIFDRLAVFDPVQDGATDASDFVKVPHFSFDDSAQELFIEWSTDLNAVRIPAESSPLMRQHLAKYEKLFGALALILHLAEGSIGPVKIESAMRAAAWCQYLEGHARRIYALAEVGKVNAAELLGRRIRDGKLMEGFTTRDVVRKGWAGVTTTAQIEAALALLEEHGWVTAAETDNPTGRPTTRFYANPKVRRAGT